MIALNAQTLVVPVVTPQIAVADVSVTENGVPTEAVCVGAGLDPVARGTFSWQGVPPFSAHVAAGGGGIYVSSSTDVGAAFVAEGARPQVQVELISSGGGATGDPAEISDTIMQRVASGDVAPVARDVVAVQRDGSAWRVIGNGRSDSETGVYTVSGLVEPGADVYLIALDDLGAVFESGASVESDDRIHPTTPNGYVYRVVTGGELPATEPDWWTTGQQQVGTATLEAREYLRPLAHGPVDVTFL